MAVASSMLYETPNTTTLCSLLLHTAAHVVSYGALDRGLIARHSCEPGDVVMCVQPAAVVQGPADEQPDPEFLVPAVLEAARQPRVLAALSCLYDGTGTGDAAVAVP